MTEVTLLFGSVHQERARDIARLLDALPRLCRGALVQSALGVRTSADLLVWVARFDSAVPPAARLAFWAWRLGGSVCSGPVSPLGFCDAVVHGVPPKLLGCVARALLARLPGITPELEAGPLALRLELDGPQDAGLAFDRRRDALFLPSPAAPPLGEELSLELRLSGGVVLDGGRPSLPGSTVLRADGVVTALRAAGEDGPGSPGGFVLDLVSPAPEVVDALEAHAGPNASTSRRRAPRYPVRARARLTPRSAAAGRPEVTGRITSAGAEELGEDSLENLSQGGAFVRTTEPLAVGALVRLDLELPDGTLAMAPGTVAFRNDRGVGVEFQLDTKGEAAIAEALARLTASPRRVLVVDDDLLARRMLGDALAAHGFQVFAAEDGAAGLQVLTDELLGLDLLITDVHMPGLGGERLVELIRGLGGERDLAIVVVTGDGDRSLERRLLAAGADRVLGKGQGPAAIVEAAERVILAGRRRGAGGVEAVRATGGLTAAPGSVERDRDRLRRELRSGA
jgi:CheY-like chemotaxis protein